MSTRTLFLHFEPLLLSVSKRETNAPSRESSLQSMKIPDNNNLANEREESSSFDRLPSYPSILLINVSFGNNVPPPIFTSG